MKFRLFQLKEQKRGTSDFDKILMPLRDTTHLKPITRKWLNNLPILQSDDIRKDKAWAFTTIARTGNDERLAITRTQVKRFGWSFIGISLLTVKFTHLSCYFVRGAKYVLSENLCTTLGFGKGTQGILDSIVWESDDGEVPKLSTMPPGVLTNII